MWEDSVLLAVTPDFAHVEARLCAQRVEILQKLNAKGLARTAYDAGKRMFKPEIVTQDWPLRTLPHLFIYSIGMELL